MINANAIGTFFQRKKGKGSGPLPPIPGLDGVIGLYIAKGLTNDSMKENPVWKDKSGLGNDFQMKNFSWSVGSGCGLYPINMPADLSVDQPFGTLHFTTSTAYSYTVRAGSTDPITIRFKVRGLTNDIYKHFVIRSVSDGTTIDLKRYYEDGIYEYHYEGTGGLFSVVFYNGTGTPANFSDFYVEIIPDYQGAVVFDGVDDYGVCDTFPILTKEKGYTVVALRQWISIDEGPCGLVSNVKNWSNDGAFVLESLYPENYYTTSFGATRGQKDLPHILTYQTSKSYNGNLIATGSYKGTDVLHVGKLASTNVGTRSNVAIWELVFLDHDATEEELTKIKDYFVKTYPWLFPDQAWAVTGKTNDDEDRATVKNLTGNGNDLRLSNFAFAGDSGYGLYKYDFKTFNYAGPSIQSTKYSDKFVVDKANASQVNVIISSSQFKCKVKVSGLSKSISLEEVSFVKIYDSANISNGTELLSDGIYDIDINSSSNIYLFVRSRGTIDNPTVLQSPVIIEQIPDYEGYLVTDGVDDFVASSNFNLYDDFTFVGEWILLSTDVSVNAGIIKASKLYIYNDTTGISLFINGTGSAANTGLAGIKSLKAVCSDGRVYDENWNEITVKFDVHGRENNPLILGSNANYNRFTSMAFKNGAFYSDRLLTKEQCIAGYNLLQTFKNS